MLLVQDGNTEDGVAFMSVHIQYRLRFAFATNKNGDSGDCSVSISTL